MNERKNTRGIHKILKRNPEELSFQYQQNKLLTLLYTYHKTGGVSTSKHYTRFIRQRQQSSNKQQYGVIKLFTITGIVVAAKKRW